jgi:uncharacterized protein (DUF2267 family)
VVRYDEFIATVRVRGAFETRARAASAARATLRTLAEQVDRETANGLAEELPPELAPYIRRGDGAAGERYSADEFWSRLAERADVHRPDAKRVARAVLDELSAAVSAPRLASVWAELPPDLLGQLDRRRGPRRASPGLGAGASPG